MSSFIGQLIQDNDGHWYLIPIEKISAFKKLIKKDDWENIIEHYTCYRINGLYAVC